MIGSGQHVLEEGAGLSLLFDAGHRPTVGDIRDVAAADGSSFSIGRASSSVGEPLSRDIGVELDASGFFFDLHDLAPGSPASAPRVAYRFALDDLARAERAEAITLMPGPPSGGTPATLPQIRTLWFLAATLMRATNSFGAAWHPARSIIGRHEFLNLADAWSADGVFPAFGLTALGRTSDGALESEGLAIFLHQELRIEPQIAQNWHRATRIATYLTPTLVDRGRLRHGVELAGPDGEILLLEPSGDESRVRVWATQ